MSFSANAPIEAAFGSCIYISNAEAFIVCKLFRIALADDASIDSELDTAIIADNAAIIAITINSSTSVNPLRTFFIICLPPTYFH